MNAGLSFSLAKSRMSVSYAEARPQPLAADGAPPGRDAVPAEAGPLRQVGGPQDDGSGVQQVAHGEMTREKRTHRSGLWRRSWRQRPSEMRGDSPPGVSKLVISVSESCVLYGIGVDGDHGLAPGVHLVDPRDPIKRPIKRPIKKPIKKPINNPTKLTFNVHKYMLSRPPAPIPTLTTRSQHTRENGKKAIQYRVKVIRSQILEWGSSGSKKERIREFGTYKAIRDKAQMPHRDYPNGMHSEAGVRVQTRPCGPLDLLRGSYQEMASGNLGSSMSYLQVGNQ
ncbi:hypothetical protein F4780DRAFT_780439 [Xylariomycetidae sp. FL0641]|nr:hypothetical protein F4780DRAFT_780439 [Xylariomycetidae sp. FL0641]